MGLAMGVMVTYGSYLSPTRRLPGAVVVVALGDTLFSITAGLIIFPALFTFGLDPAQGPALAFVVLPQAFSQITGGAWDWCRLFHPAHDCGPDFNGTSRRTSCCL